MTSVRKIAALLLAAGCIGLTAGCSKTLSGAKEDAAQDTQQVRTDADQAVDKTAEAAHNAVEKTTMAAHNAEEAAHNADQAVKNAAGNVGAAATVTPEVKTAIIRDPVLNDPHNKINVSSHNHEAVLAGHVMTDDMKQRAAEDAQVVLDKRHPDYKVVNDLTVSGGS